MQTHNGWTVTEKRKPKGIKPVQGIDWDGKEWYQEVWTPEDIITFQIPYWRNTFAPPKLSKKEARQSDDPKYRVSQTRTSEVPR